MTSGRLAMCRLMTGMFRKRWAYACSLLLLTSAPLTSLLWGSDSASIILKRIKSAHLTWKPQHVQPYRMFVALVYILYRSNFDKMFIHDSKRQTTCDTTILNALTQIVTAFLQTPFHGELAFLFSAYFCIPQTLSIIDRPPITNVAWCIYVRTWCRIWQASVKTFCCCYFLLASDICLHARKYSRFHTIGAG